jgi:choice-of-anchor C domain-containing protein
MRHPEILRRTRLLVLLSCVLAAPAHANLIVNGSFETGPAPGDATQLSAGSTAIAGWVVLPSNIDYVGTRWTAAEGGRSIGLNGSAAGGIAQTFQTVPTARYSVRFWMAGDPLTEPSIKHLRVSAAGSSGDHAADITGMWAWDPGWNSHMFSFTANSTNTTLQFSSLDGGDAGPSIDSVTVAAVPSTGAGDRDVAEFTLSPMSPNPLLSAGQVEFGVPRAAAVFLRVLDVSGRQVAVLASGAFAAGGYHATWDGRRGGARAPGGVYFVELNAAGERRIQRVVLLR